MFTRQSSCFVHFSWFLLIMASQSIGQGFVVPWRGMHEVLLVCVSNRWGALSRAMRHKSLYSNICICMGPGFPGAQAHGWGGWSINWQLAAIATPPTQDFGKLWPSQLYRQTHNLLIIHLIFLAERLQGTIWDILRATHNWYHLGNAYCPERELRGAIYS